MTRIWPGVIEHFKEFLPISYKTPIITLYEGNTPIVKAENLEYKIEKEYGIKLNIYLKYEGANPTGSFKDRGMTVAISKAKEENSKIIICASTGNTSASAAAYAAKANMRCVVLIPYGAIALGKLSQAVMHGAEVFAIKGNFDDALKLAKEISQKYPIKLVNSLNPYRIEGQKTASFEIIEQLGFIPDYQFMPVGNAGNITAYWRGYKEFVNLPKETKIKKFKVEDNKLPKMMGFQAKGAAPIVLGKPIKNPKTIATAIRIGNPASWKGALQAKDESKGVIDTVSDREILQAYYTLSSLEGLFIEPASAASIAGIIKYLKIGYFKKFKSSKYIPKIVAILTGHGLKDPDCAIDTSKKYVKIKKIPPEIKTIIKELKL